MFGVGRAPEGAKVKKSIPLPASVTPTGAFPLFRLVISPPLGSSAYGVLRSPVPVPGTFQFPGAAAQGPGGAQKLRNVAPTVNVPPFCIVPVIGIAMAGTARMAKATHAKPNC